MFICPFSTTFQGGEMVSWETTEENQNQKTRGRPNAKPSFIDSLSPTEGKAALSLSQDGAPGDRAGISAKRSGSGSRLCSDGQTGRGGAGAWRSGLCRCGCRCLRVAGSRAGGRAVSRCRSWRCRRWWFTPWCCSVWWIISTGERVARGDHTAQGC